MELAQAIAKRSWIKIISFNKQFPKFLYPGKTDRDPSPKPTPDNTDYILSPLRPWTWFKTIREIYKVSPEILIFQWWTTYWSFAFIAISFFAKLRKIPIAFLIHNVLPHETIWWDPFLARQTLKYGQIHFVQSENELIKLKNLLPSTECVYCPHPTYSFFTKNRQEKNIARKVLNLSDDCFILLFFGIIRPYKGLSDVLAALNILRNEDLKPRLIIAGEFWDNKTKYRSQIIQYDLTNQVQIIDRYILDHEVTNLFSAADAFIAPYRAGTQSGAATIAQGFGLPMIISETIKDSVDYNPNHFVIPVNNPGRIAEVIKLLMVEEPNIHPVETTATWERFTNTIEDAIRKL